MINVTVKIQDEDNGAKKLARQLKSDYVAEFGWTGPKALEQHENSDQSVEDDMVVHEFGGFTRDSQGHRREVPRRSVIGDYFDQNVSEIISDAINSIDKVLNGKSTMLKSLEKLGIKHVQGMQRRIKSRIPPPLSPETLEGRKKRGVMGDIPLLDTHHAYKSLEAKASKK